MLVLNQLAGFGAGAAPYKTGGVTFDGTNDYLTRGANLTGATDDAQGTLSFWFKLNGGDGGDQDFFIPANPGGVDMVRRKSTNKFSMLVPDNAAIDSSSSFIDDDAWHHFLASWDTAASTSRVYIDDALEASGTPGTTPAWSAMTNYGIGANPNGGTQKINADLADFFLDSTRYTDLDVEANRRKFITAALKPANLGDDGSAPFSAVPIVFLRCVPGAAASTFAANKGSGGNFAITGALTASATSPSD